MLKINLFLFIFNIFLIHNIICNDNDKVLTKIIETNYGKLQGFEHKFNEQSFNVFLGIPFAQPPIEKNRFEKPKIFPKWEDIKQVTEWKPSCIQFPILKPSDENQSEDCLYLNIFAPKEASPNPDGYPVLVFLHGGAHSQGSAASLGFEIFVKRFVSRGIIVVTTQFRQGPLGYASWGDDIFPGNYGLWDQWSALRYIKRNIQHFGGDNKRVTLWGLSSGAATVSAHTLSKHSRDFFHQAIQHSGSQFSERGNSNRVIHATEKLGQKLGCDIDDSDKLKTCMKSKTLDDILDATKRIGIKRSKDSNFIKFEPRLDADFLTNDIPYLVAESPKKPTIIGLNLEEYLFFSTNPLVYHGMDAAEQSKFTEAKFLKTVKEIATEAAFGEKYETVQKKIFDFYINNKNAPAKKDATFYFRKYTQLLSDINYNMPAINEAKAKTEEGWPIYFYLNVYMNRNFFSRESLVKKAQHALEATYIFDQKDYLTGKNLQFNDDDYEMSRIWEDIIVNFVKTGNPSTEDVDWQPATLDNKFRYLEIKPYGPQMKQPIFADRIQFWTLLHKHFEFDLIRGIHKKTLRSRDEL